jgi:aldehyde:ferredoxin oxidoreductase
LTLVAATEIINAAGLCMFGYLSYPWQAIPDQLAAITGNEYDMQAIIDTGIRIFTMRHAFNLREGINPLERRLPGRLIGDPPLKDGNVKGITVDYKTLAAEFLKELDWDVNTAIPSEDSLRRLRMDFLVESMSKLRQKT